MMWLYGHEKAIISSFQPGLYQRESNKALATYRASQEEDNQNLEAQSIYMRSILFLFLY